MMAFNRNLTDHDDIMPLHLLSSMFTEYYLKGWNIVSSSINSASLHVDFRFQTLKSSQFNVGPSAAFCVQILQKLYENLRVKRWTIVSSNREAGVIHVSFTFAFRPDLKRVPSEDLPSTSHYNRLRNEEDSSNVNSLIQLFEEIKIFEEAAKAKASRDLHARRNYPNRHEEEDEEEEQETFTNGKHGADEEEEEEEDEIYEVPLNLRQRIGDQTPTVTRKPGLPESKLLAHTSSSKEALFNSTFSNSNFFTEGDQPPAEHREPTHRTSSPAYTVVFPEQNGIPEFSLSPRQKKKNHHRHHHRAKIESETYDRDSGYSRNSGEKPSHRSHGFDRVNELSGREKVLRMLESSENERSGRNSPAIRVNNRPVNGSTSNLQGNTNGKSRRGSNNSNSSDNFKNPTATELQVRTGSLHSLRHLGRHLQEFSPGSSDSLQSNQSMSVSTDNTDPNSKSSGKLHVISGRVRLSSETVELVCAMCKKPKSERFLFKPCPNCNNLYCSDCFWWCVVAKKNRCVQCYYETPHAAEVKVETPRTSSTDSPRDLGSRKSSKSSFANLPLLGRTYKPINSDFKIDDLLF